MEVLANTITTFMDIVKHTVQWQVVCAAKVIRGNIVKWPYVGLVVPTVVNVSIRMFVPALMVLLAPDVKQVQCVLPRSAIFFVKLQPEFDRFLLESIADRFKKLMGAKWDQAGNFKI